MGRSRLILKMSITALSVLLMASLGWCGGPCGVGGAAPAAAGEAGPGSDQGSVGQSYSGSQPGDAGTTSSGFSMAGGAGSNDAGGNNGRSPFVPLQDLGLKSTLAKALRVSYLPPGLGVDLKVSADFLQSRFTGGKDAYSGPPAPNLVVGAPVDANMGVALLSINGDFGLASSVCGGQKAEKLIDMGPRVQYLTYWDYLSYTGPGGTTDGAKGFTMYGGGLFGYIDLARMANWAAPSYCNEKSLLPRINFAASFGRGSAMRYGEWEVFLQLRYKSDPSTPIIGRVQQVTEVAAEFGVMSYRFDETIEQVDPAFGREGNVKYNISIPVARAVATF